MKKETRTVVYDEELRMEAYRFEGIVQPFPNCIPECRDEIEKACRFMEQHFSEHIYLTQLCRQANLSKSTLLRAFTNYFNRFIGLALGVYREIFSDKGEQEENREKDQEDAQHGK